MNMPTKAQPRTSLVVKFADRFGVDSDKLLATLKSTAFQTKEEISNEQMMALLVVADQYNLNPFTKEIYAFPDKNRGIIPIVSVDGWVRIINEQEAFDGVEFLESSEMVVPDKDEFRMCPAWIETIIYRKDRSKPIRTREYFDETYRPPFKKDGYTINGPWQTHTKRFLRHKSFIQCARIAFGFAGIYDQDEAERIRDAGDPRTVMTVGAGQSRTDAATEALKTKQAQSKPGQASPANKQGAADNNNKPAQPAATSAGDASTQDEQQDATPQADKQDQSSAEPDARTLAQIEMLQSATGAKDLEAMWDVMLRHYKKTNAEVPRELEACHHEMKEHFDN